MPTFGIEEEVFITEPERPTLSSMYYLAKLLARNPRYYYTHSASNFARGNDLKYGMMSGVEISTKACEDVDKLISDFKLRRSDVSAVSSGLIVPVGHLLDVDTPFNTCAIHIHIGGVDDKQRLYNNLLHFLPVLPLFTINSPMALGKYFGKSYRMYKSFAIGPIKSDWSVRFQDLIYSKRLGTIELRFCDPCWDMNRIRWLLKVLEAIAKLNETLDPNVSRYNELRKKICMYGLLDEISDLVAELQSIIDFPIDIIEHTASDDLKKVYDECGLVGAYSAVDNGYRNGCFEPREVKLPAKSHAIYAILGFAGYFIPRLPYYAWKGLKES